jgi:hypothetical protein
MATSANAELLAPFSAPRTPASWESSLDGRLTAERDQLVRETIFLDVYSVAEMIGAPDGGTTRRAQNRAARNGGRESCAHCALDRSGDGQIRSPVLRNRPKMCLSLSREAAPAVRT